MKENEDRKEGRRLFRGELPPDPLIGVFDLGTRTISFDVVSGSSHDIVEGSHHEIEMRVPQEGWAEQDPLDYLAKMRVAVSDVLAKLGSRSKDIVAVGIANQRETTIVWDRYTGEPLYNAILWSDIRADPTVDSVLARLPNNDKDALKAQCGLPVSPYFSALKLKWLIENVPSVRKAIAEKRCLFGTVDTWAVWNLTGGREGGVHATDVTNASRTMLMNIDTLKWDPALCKIFQIPMEILPEIRSSSEIYGVIRSGPLAGIPISGILGNQQSALVGQKCLKEGQAKNTYRSGCFLLYNTGHKKVLSTHGLVTTIGYQLGPNSKPVYALEGSVAVAGRAIKWLRENINILDDLSETETLAESVMTTGDVYFVPCFNGLYAPYWRKDARGIICGITQFTTKQHIIRAALEAVCYQTRDILESIMKDFGVPLTQLQVDGKMTTNKLLMQLQADLCGIPVIRSKVEDVTAVGAAMVAGLAKGIEAWSPEDERCKLKEPMDVERVFIPRTTHEERDLRYTKWKMAVQRSLGWTSRQRHVIPMTEDRYRLLASIPAGIYIFTSFVLLVIAKEVSCPVY